MRKKLAAPGVWRVTCIVVLGSCSTLVGSSGAFAQTNDKTTAQPPFQLKVSSNLVVVRVVVRDAEGKPVAGLQKEDFQVLDQGKEQSISQFEVETSAPPASISLTPSTVRAPGEVASPPRPGAAPTKFVALYFDDLNTSDTDMIYVREAASHYLASDLQPGDRVALFTSGKMLSDFTVDPQQIQAALAKLQSSPQSLTRIHNCPDLSDYQALEITRQENPDYSDAWQTALNEARSTCHMDAPGPDTQASQGPLTDTKPPSQPEQLPSADSMIVSTIRSLARTIVFQTEVQARSNLLGLERVVDYLSQMPGQRTIVLVSPGFLSQSEQYPLDQLIDRALRSQVVISSLDPRGLAVLMRGADTKWVFGQPGTQERLDSQREVVVQDVLAEVAQDTGGTFFHNNNDLKAGFGALAGSPIDYVLAFAPTDMKPDGKFHMLKIKLVEKHKDFSLQARRGYFAPKNEAEATAEAKRQKALDAEAQSEAQIREAMFSKSVSQQLPVGLGGKLADAQAGTRELSLVSHLDAKPLHFQKEGGHNLNTVSFVFAIFDEKDNLVMARQRRTNLNVPDGQLPDLFKEGVTISMSFQLKPGVYRIREVVTDSEEHHLTAVSTTLKVP
jgi:VWFA-related protein